MKLKKLNVGILFDIQMTLQITQYLICLFQEKNDFYERSRKDMKNGI